MLTDSSPIFLLLLSVAELSAMLTLLIPVLWLERKIAARVQNRVGPYEVGYPHGWLQPIADILKLLTKEDIVPAAADRMLFLFAPIWVATFAVWGLGFLPVAPGVAVLESPYSLPMFLAVASLPGLGVIAAGWGSANKYAFVSAMRYIGQVAAFEIPLVAAVAVPAIVYGTWDLGQLTDAQPQVGFLFGHPLGLPSFVLFLAGLFAEGNRAPFDLAEAESELVAGFSIEYSGMRFALFYLGEYASVLLLGTLGCVLWFGGYRGFGADGPHWLVLKALAMFFAITVVRWAVIRVRIDQFMRIAWVWLVPASFAVVFLAIWGWA